MLSRLLDHIIQGVTVEPLGTPLREDTELTSIKDAYFTLRGEIEDFLIQMEMGEITRAIRFLLNGRGRLPTEEILAELSRRKSVPPEVLEGLKRRYDGLKANDFVRAREAKLQEAL